MSSRSRRSSSSARRGRRSATSTATSTSNEAQPVSDELAALISSTVREEIRRLSTAPLQTSSSADQSASASSADLQSTSASQVPPPPGGDDLLGPPMGLDLEAGPSNSLSTSQSAAHLPTKLGQRILRGEYVNLDKLLPENLSKQPKEQICWQASADTHAPLTWPSHFAFPLWRTVFIFWWFVCFLRALALIFQKNWTRNIKKQTSCPNFISKGNLKNAEQGFLVHTFYLLGKQKEMSLARPVFNLKAVEFTAFLAYFHLYRHLKVIQLFQEHAKTLFCRQAFILKKKNHLKIAL